MHSFLPGGPLAEAKRGPRERGPEAPHGDAFENPDVSPAGSAIHFPPAGRIRISIDLRGGMVKA